MDRRGFLKTLGAASATSLLPSISQAEGGESATEMVGILVDTTRCAGCRACEEICAETNGLPMPDIDDESVFDQERDPSETQWSVINRFETDKGEFFVKRQCMHCVQPACTSACLTKAMLKTEEGPVIWREDKCMGCRFCMVSCPFDMPKFEYHAAVPKIQKCRQCFERIQEGQQPACVENCPAEALTFGKRTDLLREARRRIYESPDEYVDHIYGEHEVGGTGTLYLAGVPFDQLGFNTGVGTKSYPELTTDFLYTVPIILTLWPPMLLAMSRATRKEEPQVYEVVSNERSESRAISGE